MTHAFLPGFLLGLSLILAIGAQNAFVLRQGLRQQYVFAVSLTCALSDAILIAAGVAGFGAAVAALPWLETAMRYGGAAFLFLYAARSLRRAALPSRQPDAVRESGGGPLDRARHLPGLHLAQSARLSGYRGAAGFDFQPIRRAETAFALGAISASFLFFFTLGYGARLLRPLFAQPKAWRVLDLLVAVAMFCIGLGLLI